MITLHPSKRSLFATLSVAILLSSLPSIQAALVITNGSFELNGGAGSTTLTNWTTVDSGNGDTYAQSGVTSPLSGFAVPAPTQGTFAAMTDQGGPGTHIFYQDFLVPFGIASGTLDFDLFIGNRDGNFTPGNPLDHTAVSPNQLARVDILKGGSAPASILPADVLLNVYQTQAADPLVSGYTPINANLTALLQAHQGETLRLRFAEVDNSGFFQMGVDNVRLDATTAIPEPTTALFGLALLGTAMFSRRRKV
jgi:hypothetical protein